MSVPVEIEPSFSAGAPEELFQYPFFRRTFVPSADYDVAPDGESFLVVDEPEHRVREVHVITNIVAELD
jgi:hypothetical protein